MDGNTTERKIAYRKMTANDIQTVAALDKQLFTLPWDEATFDREINDNVYSTYVVAEIDSEIIGYGGVWCVHGDAQVTNIGVREDYRGQGIAQAIMYILLDIAKLEQCTNISLEVRLSNAPAQHVYRKVGFQDGGVRKNYYQDNGEDAKVMWKQL
ncbi:MAG: ribosomal protein S18-alanine N-acetyltransferase [Bacilli bacterium]